jgi:gas vesicle protein
MAQSDNSRKSKQTCIQILTPKSDDNQNTKKNDNQCIVSFTFNQFSGFINNLTKEFCNTIKDMVHKFEEMNNTKINNLEGHIFQLSTKVEKLESNISNLNKVNQTLKLKLCEAYLNLFIYLFIKKSFNTIQPLIAPNREQALITRVQMSKRNITKYQTVIQ